MKRISLQINLVSFLNDTGDPLKEQNGFFMKDENAVAVHQFKLAKYGHI